MLDLRFRPVAKSSSADESPFSPGDVVVSFLYQESDGVIERWDISEEAAESSDPPGPVLCRWRQRIEEKDESEAEAKRKALLGAEDLFISLQDGAEEGEKESDEIRETRRVLLFFLGLHLERKRILRSKGGGAYFHVKSKKTYQVESVELGPELIQKLQPQIENLIF